MCKRLSLSDWRKYMTSMIVFCNYEVGVPYFRVSSIVRWQTGRLGMHGLRYVHIDTTVTPTCAVVMT